MDVGKISDKFIDSTISNTKASVEDGEFERRLEAAYNNKDDQELKKVCKEFEGIMLDILYKQMKSTVQKANLIPMDSGTEIFESMLDEKMVQEVSRSKGVGLADTMYKQLSKKLKSTYKVID